MTDQTIVLDSLINDDLTAVREIIKKSNTRGNLYEVVVRDFSQGTRNTPDQINYIEAYEKALAVFRTSAKELRKEMDVLNLEQRLGTQTAALEDAKLLGAEKKVGDKADKLQRQVTDAILLSNRYALAFAGYVGLALLGSDKVKVDKRFTFGTKYDSSKERDVMTGMLAEIAASDIAGIVAKERQGKAEIKDDMLKYGLESIFTTWVEQFNWLSFEDIAKARKVENTKLQYGNFSMVTGEFKKKSDIVIVDDKIQRVRRADIIGNEEYVGQVWNSLKRLLCWDESRRENPLSPPQATFTFGDPGGGKTFTAHGLIREAAELAKRKGLPFWAFPLSITDIGSKYQNESPQKLNEYIEQIVAFPGAVAMYIADADAVIPSRENQHATPEDIKLAGVFFSMFDGSRIPKGKFLPIMDANFTDNMGEALKSRIMSAQLLELKRFASADEFSKYAKGYMTRGGAVVGVTEDGWNEIGQYLINSKLNNREISNLLNDLRSKFDVPDDLIDKDFDAKVKFRNEYLKGIDKAKILGVFDKFVETQMEIKRASYDARQRHAMDQFRIDLATPKNKGSKRVVGAA